MTVIFSRSGYRHRRIGIQVLPWLGVAARLRLVILASVLLTSFPIIVRAADPVVIAVVGPMVGTSFSVGVQYQVGVTAVLASLPEGKLLGRTVSLMAINDECKASIAEKVALDLAPQSPAIVIGHSCSAATIAAAPIYARNAVLQITPASTNPSITEMGIPTIFRMIGRDDIQGRMAADRIAKRHAEKRLGIVYFPGAYSRYLTQTALETLAQRGIQPVVTIEGRASSVSYAEPIQSLMDAQVEVLYIVGGALDTGIFLRQARAMDAPFHVISGDTLVSQVFVETAGETADGVPFTFPPEAAELPSSGPAVTAIRTMGLEPVGYTLLAYAATQTWIEGVRRAQSFEAQQVATAIRQAPIESILGSISFDDKGDIRTQYSPFAWYTWQDGERVPAD